MSFEIEGTLHKVFETENKTATFQAREFVIKTEGTYPQFVKFQLTQDRCSIVDPYKEGEQLKVYFDLRGREWNEKYFTNLNAWKIEKVSAQEAAPFPSEEPVFSQPIDSGTDSDELDDLPF